MSSLELPMSRKSAPDGNHFLRLTSSLSLGSDYRRVIRDKRSAVVILAPHGGGIEPGTAKIATGIAGSDLSLYVFEGTRRQNNRNLHIPSTKFDDPQCLALLHRTSVAIAIHGCKGQERIVYLGGRNHNYRNSIHNHLQNNGFHVELDDTHHAGVHSQNICNRCKSRKGVQLELTTGLRKTFFKSLDRPGRDHLTENYYRFIRAARQGLLNPVPHAGPDTEDPLDL